MSKFPDKKSRKLYAKDPSDQVGSSSEGPGWAGLYIRAKRPGGHILVEHPDGFVDHHVYDDEGHMREAWANFEKALETREPAEEDWIIHEPSSGLPFISQAGSPISGEQCLNRDHAVRMIREHMKEDQFFPDVWIVNERGEAMLYEMPQD